jgi:hypothetical protein
MSNRQNGSRVTPPVDLNEIVQYLVVYVQVFSDLFGQCVWSMRSLFSWPVLVEDLDPKNSVMWRQHVVDLASYHPPTHYMAPTSNPPVCPPGTKAQRAQQAEKMHEQAYENIRTEVHMANENYNHLRPLWRTRNDDKPLQFTIQWSIGQSCTTSQWYTQFLFFLLSCIAPT